MATDRQIAANQRNAQKSTGPRTTGGKLSSKLNAVRHGLTAEQIIIPGEDPGEFEALRGTLIEELEPDGEMEARLVERIATCMWRLRRLTTVEAGIFTREAYAIEENRADRAVIGAEYALRKYHEVEEEEEEEADEDHTTNEYERTYEEAHQRRVAAREALTELVPTLGEAFINDARRTDALGKLSRYEANIERSLYRALHELQRLQKARRTGEDIAPVAVDVTIDVDPKLNDD